MSDLILNSRLPVGLVTLGIQSTTDRNLVSSSKEGLLRMRRLGALIHSLNFCGTTEEIQWVEEMQIEGIHIDLSQLRSHAAYENILAHLKNSSHSPIKTYASNITLIKDIENASNLHIDYCYGGLMMAPVSRHQILQINDSRIAKAIFSLHPHQHPNQNGDK
jgi:hypothetical protein